MAVKVNLNTVIDDHKNIYLNNIQYVESRGKQGWSSGGNTPPATNVIDKFSFANPFVTATDAGNLTSSRYYCSGVSSLYDGYACGGSPPLVTSIDQFPFSSPFVTASDYGDLSINKWQASGHQSDTDGFTGGGGYPPILPSYLTVIDKFPFSTPWPGTATDIGDLYADRVALASQSSGTYGYSCGHLNAPEANMIDSYPFYSPFTTATDTGNLSVGRCYAAGQQSTTDGYTSGGASPPSTGTNYIDQFPFSSPFTTATDVGNLSSNKWGVTGQSGLNGYTSGGTFPTVNVIEYFPFTSPFITVTDAGNLSVSRSGASGHQG